MIAPRRPTTQFPTLLFILSIIVATGAGAVPPLSSPTGELTPAIRPTPSDDRSEMHVASRESLMGLRSFKPYERGKIPVVFVHGLWGRPENFDEMIVALDRDRETRESYQFWTYEYPTAMLIADSTKRLELALSEARRVLDPGRNDPAFDQLVVVGHSMGGLLAKSLATRSKADGVTVGRMIFIATPHQGSPLAKNLLGRFGKALYNQNDFEASADRASKRATTHNAADQTTSIDQLAEGHPSLLALNAMAKQTRLPFHSIIADRGFGHTDGVVPYRSSHLEGAESELIVKAGHLCFNQASVILEVQRILSLHRAIQIMMSTRVALLGGTSKVSAK